jgi:hypothetical protein
MLALSMLSAGSALAEPDRVIRGPVTQTPETRGGVAGIRIKYTEYTYRKFSDQVAALVPNHGLTATEIGYVQAILAAGNVSPITDAILKAVITAMKTWKGTIAEGQNHDWVTSSRRNNGVNTYTNSLMNAILGATGRGANSWNGNEWNQANAMMWSIASGRGWTYSDPLVFDLNGNGKIDVTGLSSAKIRAEKNMQFVAEGSVLFDIRGKGTPDRIEWVKAGDGILVDNRKNKAKQQVAAGKPLNIAHLFGDTDGNTGGFMKLAREFHANAKVASGGSNVAADLGILKGKDLEDMLMWVDNGDGKAEAKELHTLASLGITEIRLPHRFKKSQDDELIEFASFVRNGKTQLVEEVWFGREDNVDYRFPSERK